ncbi:hypothetical protein PGT21_035951 [Puccinia graminis f. sp. tritici]|uniref:Uncharacterized protein n=1 Tax=Puccinia graminis f. sp. tritici TaxID=56615 RepID=A0A5B0NGI0_PUCGR|nr:hypothetical protein PGT21_035951 [Puccinia graminis f. sp. tritici]KAA1138214.1 hypothetical protein PGTUg99_019638 [Puccinia graminis f. sp. tritici]
MLMLSFSIFLGTSVNAKQSVGSSLMKLDEDLPENDDAKIKDFLEQANIYVLECINSRASCLRRSWTPSVCVLTRVYQYLPDQTR